MFLRTRKWLLARIVDAVLIYRGCYWGALFGAVLTSVFVWLFPHEVAALQNAMLALLQNTGVQTSEPFSMIWIFSGAAFGALVSLIHGRFQLAGREKQKTPR